MFETGMHVRMLTNASCHAVVCARDVERNINHGVQKFVNPVI